MAVGPVDNQHVISWPGVRAEYASAKVMTDEKIVAWFSGWERNNEDTWYSNESFLIVDRERYDQVWGHHKRIMRQLDDLDCRAPDYYLQAFREGTPPANYGVTGDLS